MMKSEQKCEYCMNGRALATGKSDKPFNTDYGISMWKSEEGTDLLAYGYNPKGDGGNTIRVRIAYCPMCGRDLRKYYDENLPCNKRKCDPSTRASCCGCPEYFEYMKKKNEKESKSENALKKS